MNLNHISNTFLLFALIAFSLPAFGQQRFFSEEQEAGLIEKVEGQMTLKECLLFAIKNNPDIQKAKLDRVSNDYMIKELKSQGLPSVNAGGSYTDNFALPSQILPGEIIGAPGTSVPVKFGVRHSFNGNIEARQMIFDKSFFTGLKAARASNSLIELNTFLTKEDLVFNIAQIFLQVQITEEQKAVLENNLERINQLIDIAQIQFEEGLIKKVDVDQLVVNRTNLYSEIQNLEIQIEEQMSYLKYYMGMPQNEEIELADDLEDSENYELAPELILSENTTLKVIDKQLELSAFELDNIKSGYYPTLSIFANYGWQGQVDKLFSKEDEMNSFGSGAWGLTLNVPIFDGFRKRNQQQQTLIKIEQLRLDKKSMTNLTRMDFKNANNTLSRYRTLLKLQEDNQILAEELYEITKLSYTEGVAPLTELLNAETSLKEAQTQYLTALLQLKLGGLGHMKTSGQLAKLIKSELN